VIEFNKTATFNSPAKTVMTSIDIVATSYLFRAPLDDGLVRHFLTPPAKGSQRCKAPSELAFKRRLRVAATERIRGMLRKTR
jgi:hypothetical protein